MPDYYPENIIPQVRSPRPSSPLPNLKCPPDDSQQFILLDIHNLAVIRGWEWKSNIELKDFFVPISDYLLYEFNLKFDSDYTKYVTLNYGNMGDPIEGVLFVCIFPLYHTTELNNQSDWKIHWRYLDDPDWTETGIYGDGYNTPNSPEDEDTWRQLGKLMILNGTKEKPVKPIHLQNRTGKDIPIKILIGA